MMKVCVIFIVIMTSLGISTLHAQSRDNEEKIKVIEECLSLSAREGKLHSIAHKYKYKGTLVYQLAWKKGGKILHCRMLQAETDEPVFLSQFQRAMMNTRCKVKIKPGEQIKMNYSFEF